MKFLCSLLTTLALVTALPDLADAKPPTDAELTACLGAKGTSIPAFAKLRRGMKPTEVAAVFAGADKPDKYGFAKVTAKDCAGAQTFRLYYQKDRKTGELALYSVGIEFDKALTGDPDFYKRITTLLVAKYGPLKDPDKELAKRILTWGTPDGVAQFSTIGDRYPLRLSGPLPR